MVAIQVISLSDCPHGVPLVRRLRNMIRVFDNASLDHVIVEDLDGMRRYHVSGSPTMLVDGVDPFAIAGQSPSLSCRLYRDEQGQSHSMPSGSQLRSMLADATGSATEITDGGVEDE